MTGGLLNPGGSVPYNCDWDSSAVMTCSEKPPSDEGGF